MGGVAFVNYSIETNSLPVVNPLIDNNEFFKNIYLAFLAVISHISLLFGVNILYLWSILSIAFSIVICYLSYLILRLLKVPSSIAILSMLLLPTITVSTRLPGLWHLIPFTFGVIFLLQQILVSLEKKSKLAVVNSALTILFYPPFFIISIPTLAIYLLREHRNAKIPLKRLLIYSSLLAIPPALILFFQFANIKELIDFFLHSAYHDNFGLGIIRRNIFYIVPFFSIIFSFVGLIILAIKKKVEIVVPIILLLFLWLFYTFNSNFIFLDFARVAVIASYLLVIISVYGFYQVLSYFCKRLKLKMNNSKLRVLGLIIIIFFILKLPNYTENNNWNSINPSFLPGNQSLILNQPPKNNFFSLDDYEVFSKFNGKRFISNPVNSLEIGASTNNYPIISKPSFVTNQYFSYHYFLSRSCQRRLEIMQEQKIDYIYTEEFDCPGFVEVNRSSDELLVLYEISEN